MKQLDLFKRVDIMYLDALLFEYHNLVYAMKSLAYQFDITFGQGAAFDKSLVIARLSANVVTDLKDSGLRYCDWSDTHFDKVLVYDPYYGASEPRTKDNLIEAVDKYKVGCNRLKMRIEGCLKDTGIRIPREITKIVESLEQLKTIVANEKYKL